MTNRVIRVCLGIMISVAAVVPAAGTSGKGIPPELSAWKEWVLYKHPERSCPIAFNDVNQRFCAWPSRLDLTVDRQKAQFEQRWIVYSAGWVALPGGGAYWPAGVTANGRPAPASDREGLPCVYLEPGDYVIRGTIAWARRPESLSIPVQTGIVNLILDGETIRQKNISDKGELWFGKGAGPRGMEAADAVKVEVFRKWRDGVPIVIETQLSLAVSGKDRELRFGRFLPAGGIPFEFESPLSARIEPDGRLRIQARAGEWNIRCSARYPGPVSALSMEKLDDAWPAEEIWVFEAAREIRTVSVTGAKPVDPRQTSLPDEWHSLPAFLMEPGTTLAVEEQHRGVTDPSDNDLRIDRELWLDFDGRGLTARDRITGTLNRGWRLGMAPGDELGRVDVNNEPQLITQTEDGGRPGIEVRQGKLDVLAVSRHEGGISRMSATGWNQDFSGAAGRLHLPPGWMLLYARGVDTAFGSWIQSWDLWDLFLVLLVAVAFGRIIHPFWGIVSGVTLALVYHEPLAPVFIWLNLAVALALLKIPGEGWAKKLLRYYLYATFLTLAVLVLIFCVDQVRQGLYPQLEGTRMGGGGLFSQDISMNVDKLGKAERPQRRQERRERMEERAKFSKKAEEAESPAQMDADNPSAPAQSMQMELRNQSFGLSAAASPEYKRDYMRTYDVNAQIQTGPGEPSWSWRQVNLVWNGPVTKEQELRLVFISPAVNRAVKFVRALLVVLLAAVVFVSSRSRRPGFRIPFLSPGLLPVALVGFAIICAPAVVHAADMPDENMLKELEARLTESPKCLPNCASISRARLEVSRNAALFHLMIDALDNVSVPLPAHRDHWMPEVVRVDTGAAVALSQDNDGQLYLALPAGTHDVVLQGAVIGDLLEFPVILPAHNVAVDANGWQVSGLVDAQVPGKSLQLNRVVRESGRREETLLPSPIAPFVVVERTLELGLEWHVRTKVMRVAPQVGAIHLEVPELKRSSVVTPGVNVQKNPAGELRSSIVKVDLSPGDDEVTWESMLEISDSIELTAAAGTQWVEHWVLDAATIWHVEPEGISPVRPAAAAGVVCPRWQPWPGEKLHIGVTRPMAVPGSAYTIESVTVTSTPGLRVTDHVLQMSVRAGRGGDYTLRIPSGVKVRKVTIDDQEQPNPPQSGEIKVPLHPGVQSVSVAWQENRGMGLVTRTPGVDLGTAANNIRLNIQVPRDRWPLWVSGPRLGPAVLYWGVLIVIIVLASLLGRSRLAPLKTYEWILLLVGLSTVNFVGGIIVAVWFFALAGRKKLDDDIPYNWFNLMQVLLVVLTVAAAVSLIATVPMSLLSKPDMQITGNDSTAHMLRWYQDRTTTGFPQGSVLSTSIWIYRFTMLCWSLWIVFALVRWSVWAWSCFSSGTSWKRRPKIERSEK